jgi:hypothetical protein
VERGELGAAGPRIVNLTPHPVVVRWDGGERVFPSAGVARLVDSAVPVADVDGVPVAAVSVGQVTGLPDPQPGCYLLVSRLTAAALPLRTDLLFPFEEIRDEQGRVVAVARLARLA